MDAPSGPPSAFDGDMARIWLSAMTFSIVWRGASLRPSAKAYARDASQRELISRGTPWETVREKEHRRLLEKGVPAGRTPQLSGDVPRVGAHFVLPERPQVVEDGNPLSQLPQGRVPQSLAELRLPDQDDLNEKIVPDLQIGEHAQFFEGFERKILGLVHHDDTTVSGTVLFHEVVGQGKEEVVLAIRGGVQFKFLHEHFEEAARVQVRVEDHPDVEGVLRFLEEVLDEGGLPCAHLSRESHKAHVLDKTIFQMVQGKIMAPADK